MDKPYSMSVKDYLMRKMSVRTNTPLKIIEAVIDHQLQGANEALKNKNTIELSGFGKFIFNVKKAHKKLDKQLSKEKQFKFLLLVPGITEAKKKSLELKLENTLKTIESIKSKLHGVESNSGRVEEQANSPQRAEGADRADFPREDGDLQGVSPVL